MMVNGTGSLLCSYLLNSSLSVAWVGFSGYKTLLL